MDSWQVTLSLSGNMCPVLASNSHLRTDQFDGEDRPHQLQWTFEPNKARHLVRQDVAVVMEVGRELAEQGADEFLYRPDNRFKRVLRGSARLLTDADHLFADKGQFERDRRRLGKKSEDVHRFGGALRQ